jgi:hypothetical protein
MNLTPRRSEVRFDAATGLVQPHRGIPVFSRPDGLERFGSAYRVVSLPPELRIIQVGRDQNHYEIVPDHPMTFDEYADALQKIVLQPA